ncbi:MAG: hypothetical protein EOP85_17765 [Verrucomicrobiaceae bacterium]|nr:MAG: hypothetical protein EOP85_17765 [Verrucomicrobiaceae bacterium]
MKNLILAAFTLVVSAQLSCAGLLDDLVGKWKVDDTKPGYSITTVFKRVGSKGLQSKSTIVIPGMANATGTTKYNANGTVTGNVKRGGVIQVKMTGTWRISGNTLIENVKLTSPVMPGSTNQNTKIKRVSAKKLKTTSTIAGGRTTGSLSKVR